MVNIQYCMSASRNAFKRRDWPSAINILSVPLCWDIKNRRVKAKLWIERARIFNIMERYENSWADSKQIIILAPTNYRGYNHAAIAAYGLARYDDALLSIHAGLEKVTDHLPLVVRLMILLEAEEYKDFVQQVAEAETKATLQAFIADEENEFLELFKILKDKSDEAFTVFRAVALVAVGRLNEGQEVVDMAELRHSNRPSLMAAKEFLKNPEALVACMLKDIHFEEDETPFDLAVEPDVLLSDSEAEEDPAGVEMDDLLSDSDEEENEDTDVMNVEDDDEEENKEFVKLDENGGGDQQSGERNDSGLGGDNE